MGKMTMSEEFKPSQAFLNVPIDQHGDCETVAMNSILFILNELKMPSGESMTRLRKIAVLSYLLGREQARIE
jgi:hypothetical protein